MTTATSAKIELANGVRPAGMHKKSWGEIKRLGRSKLRMAKSVESMSSRDRELCF
jgi:hypothetical protein